MNGVGVEKDPVKAVELYTKAAEAGNARAQCNLGWCYENGVGVEKDPVKAVELVHEGRRSWVCDPIIRTVKHLRKYGRHHRGSRIGPYGRQH